MTNIIFINLFYYLIYFLLLFIRFIVLFDTILGPFNRSQMVLMSKLQDRSKVLLSLDQEVERQTTEDQFAENEGHVKEP